MDNHTKYFPLLDSFRAIAVILILLFHAMPKVFPFGWIGVPMFFVLSGYLITGILRKYSNKQHYFRIFYLRRILRIFPIYYLVLVLCTIWSRYLNLDLSQFAYYFFYLQSYSISEGLQPVFANELMSHTWSLSVEEIFYFIWPTIIYFLNKRSILFFCIALIIFSVIYKINQYSSGHEQLAGLSFFSNLDSLMFGALLSLYYENKTTSASYKRNTITILLLLLNLILIYLLYFSNNVSTLQYGKLILTIGVSVFSYYFVLFLVTPAQSNSLSRLLSRKEYIFIGKISYGLYLYHFPIYIFIRSYLYHYNFSLNSVVEMVIKISITFIVAIFSWYLIEKPILKLKTKFVY